MPEYSWKEFKDDDRGYLAWLRTHPDGYVLTVPRNKRRVEETNLHLASCSCINHYSEGVGGVRRGGFTETTHYKVCALDLDSLRRWLGLHRRGDLSFPSWCGLCNPLTDILQIDRQSAAKHL